ncbi:hypothetical protein GCM10022394_13250 [Zobellella aerophila]|uniref:Uncharacterized protein n=1 Tax=Zobellella aerophila TaxID=870480 RepID=A0ABP6VJ39_9GAMM
MQVVMMDMAEPVDDCCNDADMAAKTGKPCKTGQECPPSSHACALISFATSTREPEPTEPVSTFALFPSSFDPSGVWRPPTFF